MSPMMRKTANGLIIGLVAALLVAGWSVASWPDVLELKLLDLRHRWFPPDTKEAPVVLIAIDDASLEQVGRWTWPRRYLAHIIRLCRQAGAATVVLDILLPEEEQVQLYRPGLSDVSRYEPAPQLLGTPETQVINNDEILAGTIEEMGQVVLPFHATLIDDPPTALSTSEAEDTLAQKLQELLAADPDITFLQAYRTIWPERDITVVDADYHQLLNGLNREIALRGVRRLGWDIDNVLLHRQPVLCWPYLADVIPPFRDFAPKITDTGYVSVRADHDGVVRQVALLAHGGEKIYRHLALTAACAWLQIGQDEVSVLPDGDLLLDAPQGVIRVPLDRQGRMLVSWSPNWANSEQTAPVTVLAQLWQKEQALANGEQKLRLIDDLDFLLSTVPDDLDALDDETKAMVQSKRRERASLGSRQAQQEAVADLQRELKQGKADLAQRLQGKVVFVGSVATAVPDFFVTPMGELTPGVAVHHNVLSTILGRHFIRRVPRGAELALLFLLGVLMAGLTVALPARYSLLLVMFLVAAWFGLSFAVFGGMGYWLAVVGPIAAILAAYTMASVYQQVTEGRARRRITARFKQYASPAVVDRIVTNVNEVSFAGETRELSCYFSDLAGFTSISEQLGPEKTVSILNLYLDRMTEVLDRYDATVNKFEGDGIFAFFGAPIDLPNHSELACRAALDAQKVLHALVTQQQIQNPDFPNLTMRIGVSTGLAVVGDCGSTRRFDYTAIGDTVNFAARLESANKQLHTQIMVCQTTYEQAQHAVFGRRLGRLRVVGKARGVEVVELVGLVDESSGQDKDFVVSFETAVKAYQDQQLDQSQAAFEQCLQARPDDGPTQLYLSLLKSFAMEGWPEDFDGAIVLQQK